MAPEDKLELIRKFLKNRITGQEMELLYRVINSPKGEEELLSSFDREWKSSERNMVEDIPSERMLQQIRSQIKRPPNRRFTLFKLMGLAAIMVLAITVFIALRVNEKKAMHASEEQLTIILAEPGQVSNHILPDGTLISLFPGSMVRYSSSYGTENRKIELEGQAFLDVQHNAALPFVVACNSFKIEVLGTRFTVEAFPGQERVRVVLESGSVALSDQQEPKLKHSMIPGELADYELLTRNLTLKKVNPLHYSSWTQGKLVFREEPLPLVLEKLGRHFNVDFDYNYSDISQSRFTATISAESLSDVLKLIKLTTLLECRRMSEADDLNIKIVVEKQVQDE
jgi:transmembrane sensor